MTYLIKSISTRFLAIKDSRWVCCCKMCIQHINLSRRIIIIMLALFLMNVFVGIWYLLKKGIKARLTWDHLNRKLQYLRKFIFSYIISLLASGAPYWQVNRPSVGAEGPYNHYVKLLIHPSQVHLVISRSESKRVSEDLSGDKKQFYMNFCIRSGTEKNQNKSL